MSAPSPTKEKRTAQISPDRLTVGFLAISLVVIVMASSMVFSYVGIAEAAAWTGVPLGIHIIAPIFIDGAIITYTVSLTIFEWRREDRKTIRHTKRVLRGFTGLSVGLNFAHTAAYWQWDFTVYEAWFGALISVSAPIAALLSAEEVVRLAFRRRVVAAVDDAGGAVTDETPKDEPTLDDIVPDIVETAPPAPPALIPFAPIVLPAPPEVIPEPVKVSASDGPAVIAEAERLIQATTTGETAKAGDDDGIVRYPVQGEVLLSAIDASLAGRDL